MLAPSLLSLVPTLPDPRHSFSKENLLSMSRGELFAPDSPRFPVEQMMMVDRITRIHDKEGDFERGIVVGQLDINPDLWFFDCHFPDDPVMPGCLGLDAMWQLAGFYLSWLGYTGLCRALGVGGCRFLGQVLQTAKLVEYRIHIKRVRALPFPQAQADATMSVDDRIVYRATALRIGVMDPSQLGIER